MNKKILDENFVFRFINVRSCQAGLFEDELELGLEIDDRCEPVVESVKTLNFDGIPKQVRFVERCGCPKAKRNWDNSQAVALLMMPLEFPAEPQL